MINLIHLMLVGEELRVDTKLTVYHVRKKSISSEWCSFSEGYLMSMLRFMILWGNVGYCLVTDTTFPFISGNYCVSTRLVRSLDLIVHMMFLLFLWVLPLICSNGGTGE